MNKRLLFIVIGLVGLVLSKLGCMYSTTILEGTYAGTGVFLSVCILFLAFCFEVKKNE